MRHAAPGVHACNYQYRNGRVCMKMGAAGESIITTMRIEICSPRLAEAVLMAILPELGPMLLMKLS